MLLVFDNDISKNMHSRQFSYIEFSVVDHLYFAHHQGTFIRMAYADDIQGPYTIYSLGVLDLSATPFARHIASSDVHVEHAQRKILVLYHGDGPTHPSELPYRQLTCYAESDNGRLFTSQDTYIGPAYLHVYLIGKDVITVWPGERNDDCIEVRTCGRCLRWGRNFRSKGRPFKTLRLLKAPMQIVLQRIACVTSRCIVKGTRLLSIIAMSAIVRNESK